MADKLECEGELLDLHLLVTNRMKPLGNAKFPGEPCNRVLINTDTLKRCLLESRRGRPHETTKATQGHSTDELTETATTDGLAPAAEQRNPWVVQGLEMEDSLNPQYCLEVQRKDQSAAMTATHGTREPFGDAVEPYRIMSEQKRSSVDSCT
ncbi:MAG: hypothetical protein MJE77_35380 [Proteobacteria bacterium]|nr:hypothetical protein [Pseudomonadota bacterium]